MLLIAGWFLFAIWIVVASLPAVWFVNRSLKRQSDRVPEPAEWPFLSVVVPARDEGHKIEEGLRSLMASDYPCFEIIAINDRSQDQTGAIMDQLSDDFSRAAPQSSTNSDQSPNQRTLRVIHITELPEGWLGKNNALQVGSRSALGEWILFTDGDVIYKTDTLRRSMKYAIAKQLDHLPLFPNIEAHSVFEAAFVACFALIFSAGTQPGLVPTRFPWFYVGVGAFNLVRRTAFERANGFEPIRMDIMDDVKLGKLLKRTGSKAEVLRAGDGLNIRWQQSAWKCITGLEKNAFASSDYSVVKLFGIMTTTLFVFLGPAAGLFLPPDSRSGFIAALVASHIVYGFNSCLFGHTFWIFPLLIPSALAFVFAYFRSAWITLRQKGVRWRGTFYPLDVLRDQVYR